MKLQGLIFYYLRIKEIRVIPAWNGGLGEFLGKGLSMSAPLRHHRFETFWLRRNSRDSSVLPRAWGPLLCAPPHAEGQAT